MINDLYCEQIGEEKTPINKTLTVNHNHNHAPAAEQARLLKDLEKQAVKNIKDKIFTSLESNGFESVSIRMAELPDFSQRSEFYSFFVLNGENFEIKTEVDPREIHKDQFYLELARAVSDEIAVKLVQQLINDQNSKEVYERLRTPKT